MNDLKPSLPLRSIMFLLEERRKSSLLLYFNPIFIVNVWRLKKGNLIIFIIRPQRREMR